MAAQPHRASARIPFYIYAIWGEWPISIRARLVFPTVRDIGIDAMGQGHAGHRVHAQELGTAL